MLQATASNKSNCFMSNAYTFKVAEYLHSENGKEKIFRSPLPVPLKNVACSKYIIMRFVFFFLLLFSVESYANDTTKLYHPYANAAKDIEQLLAKAKAEKKHLLLQIGGNWCVWCYRLNSFVQTDTLLKQLAKENYIIYHLNYSKENKNLELLKKLGYPQRFGFPVLVVLDAEGNRLHTQDSGLLEKGNGYDTEKVKAFLKNWSPGAFEDRFYVEN